MNDVVSGGLALCAAGMVGGLAALWRGFIGYRTGALVSGMSTSRIESLAAGEVRVTGKVEAAEVLLRSPLQNRDCVWYRSRVTAASENRAALLRAERGIGFRINDGSGSIRVFPRGARVDAPDRFSESTSIAGELPAGYEPRDVDTVPAGQPVDREAAIADLLTVHQPRPLDADPGLSVLAPGDGPRRFEEARLEPGDVITIVGTARPFLEIEDPADADALDGSFDPESALADPAIAADIEAARAAGTLTSPEEAWGNAAIPGFGIGQPVRAPKLDPGANAAVLATPAVAAEIGRRFDIDPNTLVLASAPDAPLLVAWGAPGEVAARGQGQFLLGLGGAVVAIGSAVAAALLLSGS